MINEALLMELQARLELHEQAESMHAEDAAQLHKVETVNVFFLIL
jgi:hypothetical protein